MPVRFCRRLRPALTHFLTTALTLATVVCCAAEPGVTHQSSCEFELAGTEELCGWVELGTHDSFPVCHIARRTEPAHVQVALPNPPQKPVSKTRAFLKAPAVTVAAVAAASAGVSVQRITEPFAMVGPYLDNSHDRVKEFQAWWEIAMNEARALKEADEKAAMEDVAAQESLDLESLGPSVLSWVTPGIEVAPLDPLVGGSAMIATIEEDYLPYDMSAEDLRLWSVFPVSTRPFCIRSHGQRMESAAMWHEFDEVVQNDVEEAPQKEPVASCGTADRVMTALVQELEVWTAADSPLWVEMEPVQIGRRLAALVTQRTRIFEGAALKLASRWPESDEQIQPSPAGEALLARAGAIEAEAPIAAPAAQIAEAPAVSSLR